MDKLRLKYNKTARGVYISHLDLMRTMQRAFQRANLPLKYSEGFNPHPQISMALPLSVGTASYCELMDFKLNEDIDLSTIPAMLNAVLPEGIEAVEVYEFERKVKELKWLRVKAEFEYDVSNKDKLENFFAAESIVIPKKTKSGIKDTDIKPGIRSIEFTDYGFEAVLSAQDPTLNPDLLQNALRILAPEIAPDFVKFTRIEVYDDGMNIFR